MILEMYKKMFLSLIPDNLEKQLKSEKGTLWDGTKYILLSSTVPILAILLGLLLYLLVFGAASALNDAYDIFAIVGGFSVFAVIISIIAVPLLMVLGAFVSNLISFIVCKLLGGKGSYTDQFYHFSIPGGGMVMLNTILRMIPCAGAPLGMLLMVYFLYPSFLIYRKVHKLSDTRAAIAALLPLLLLVGAAILALALGVLTGILAFLGQNSQGMLS